MVAVASYLLSTSVDISPAFAEAVSLPAPRPKAEPQASSVTYEGASGDRNHGPHGWMTSRLSADSALEQGETQEELRRRSRDMYRNSDVGGAIETRVDLVVGTGFTLQAKIRETAGFCTKEQAKAWNQQLEDIATEWAISADVDGKTSLWECSRLVERHHAVDGESLTVWSDVPRIDGDIPLAIEVIDPDRLQTPPNLIGNRLCRMGIQKNARGQIEGYWIRDAHPGDTLNTEQTFTFYAADRVMHIFEKWFAGQSRGLPWLTRALNRIQDGKDLDEAGIIAAQVEACYAAFVTKPPVNPLSPEDVANAEAARIRNNYREKDLHPGTIRYMESGETITFGTPPHGSKVVPDLQEMNYRRIAGALNMAYEMLARDWRGVSFAGGRLILSGVKLDTKSRQKRLRESWFRPLYHRMVNESVICGACDIPAELYSKRPRVFNRHRWVAQAWPFCITPGEEIDATLKAVNGNLLSKSDATAEMYGTDSEETFADRKAERDMEREMDIVPPDVAKSDTPADPNAAPQRTAVAA